MTGKETRQPTGLEAGPQISDGIQIYELASMNPEDKDRIMKRSGIDIEQVKPEVSSIINDIRERGDAGVLDYIEKFDGVRLTPEQLVVSNEEIEEAYEKTDPKVLRAIREQIRLSRLFHEAQFAHMDISWETETSPGVMLGQKRTPLDSAGLYVPGGTPLPSVAQILAVPARIAGVRRIVSVVSPRDPNYEVIVAADMAGATEQYRVGGVAAIAALAYGTETIKPVDKIVGPGNKYVTAAKALVFGEVGIDMVAGPSEVVIIADENANPVFCAADMLSASEHDPNAAGVLVTWSRYLAEATQKEITGQALLLERKEIIEQSLRRYSAIILVKDEKEAVRFTNEYAPEHLEIMTENAGELVDGINNAGSIFVGEWGSKAIGDFATGANHVLPTGRGARAFSPIGVETFMKVSQIQRVSREALTHLAEIMRTLSNLEGLDGHGNTLEVRLK